MFKLFHMYKEKWYTIYHTIYDESDGSAYFLICDDRHWYYEDVDSFSEDEPWEENND